MLHDALKTYLEGIETVIVQAAHVHVERYVEEILTPERMNLRIRLRIANGHLLEIHEAVVVADGAFVHLDYRYHCQDERNRLRFRYDSTPHFPSLPNFPYHKHPIDGTVVSSQRPDVRAVIAEALGVQP